MVGEFGYFGCVEYVYGLRNVFVDVEVVGVYVEC